MCNFLNDFRTTKSVEGQNTRQDVGDEESNGFLAQFFTQLLILKYKTERIYTGW